MAIVKKDDGKDKKLKSDQIKQAELREIAEVLRKVAHPTRILIIKELLEGEKCVRDIQEFVAVPQANLSQHLSILRSLRIIDFRRKGRLACYFLRNPEFCRGLARLMKSTMDNEP